MFEVDAARPWGRVRLRDPDWDLKEFLLDGKRLLLLHRRTGDLRVLPVDPVAWAREKDPPELDGSHMIVIDLVSVADSPAYELKWLERHFAPETFVSHAGEERRAGRLDAAVALAQRVLDVCPRDAGAQRELFCALAARSARPASDDAERNAREDDASRATDAVAAYLAEFPDQGPALAAAPALAPLRGRPRFDALVGTKHGK
jgi:hypothetical protein